MVGGELRLKTIRRLVRRCSHAVQGIQAHCQQLDMSWLQDIRQSRLSLGGIADLKEKLCACRIEGFDGLDANTRGASCDEGNLVRQLPHQSFILHDIQGCRAGISRPIAVLVNAGERRRSG